MPLIPEYNPMDSLPRTFGLDAINPNAVPFERPVSLSPLDDIVQRTVSSFVGDQTEGLKRKNNTMMLYLSQVLCRLCAKNNYRI